MASGTKIECEKERQLRLGRQIQNCTTGGYLIDSWSRLNPLFVSNSNEGYRRLCPERATEALYRLAHEPDTIFITKVTFHCGWMRGA